MVTKFHFPILTKSATLKSMNQMPKTALVYKNLGETPLAALERFRAEQMNLTKSKSDGNSVTLWNGVPMTYAGRLDPLAEGALLILIGEECKNKEKYLGLDKEYEVEIIFGVSTDTHDVLGLVDGVSEKAMLEQLVAKLQEINFSKYTGKLTQKYPSYSSKTVNGKQLHELARANELPEEMPERKIEIYSIDIIDQASKIPASELKNRVLTAIDFVMGDFRQNEIKAKWQEVLSDNKNGAQSGQEFPIIKIRVKCSSGTYMRSLADRIGKDIGTSALALSIKRTKIGKYSV